VINIHNVDSYTISEPSQSYSTGTIYFSKDFDFGAYGPFSIHLKSLDGTLVIISVPELNEDNEEDLKAWWDSSGLLKDSLVERLIYYISPA
jgi:hypothetical protein